jgi:hypothetical protein
MAGDVGGGAVQYLRQFSDITSLLGYFPPDDPISPNAGLPWIFKDDILVTMEGTGRAALACAQQGGWGVPQPMTTSRWQRLSVTVHIDAQRDADQNIIESSGMTKERGYAIFNAVQKHLQRTDPDAVMWGDIRTVGCQLLSEAGPWSDVADGDHYLMAQAFYGVLVFGSTDGTV